METNRHLKVGKPPRKRVVIGWKWLLGLTLVVLVIGGIAGWRYLGQSGNVAEHYLDVAEKAYQEEDWEASSDAYYQYFTFRPDDLDARIKLALAYGKNPNGQRNQKVRFYREAMALIPKPTDGADENAPYRNEYKELKVQLIDELVRSRRYSDINLEAEDDAFGFNDLQEMRRAIAWSAYVTAKVDDRSITAPIRDPQRPGEVILEGKSPLLLVQEYLREDPGDIELANFAAFGLREANASDSETEQNPEADAIIERMVSSGKNQEDSRAWLTRYNYRRTNDLPGFEDDLQQAIDLYSNPRDAIPLGIAAIRLARQSVPIDSAWLDRAIQMFEKAHENAPELARPVMRLSEAYALAGEFEKSIAVLEESIDKVKPAEAVEMRLYLADLYLNERDVENCQKQVQALEAVVASAEQNSQLFQSQRRRLEFEASVELFKAKVYLLTREFSKARKIAFSLVGRNLSDNGGDDTGRVISSLGSGSGMEKQLLYDSWMLIGQSSESLGRWAESANAYEAASELGMDTGEAASLAAESYRQAGQSESALRIVERQSQLGREPLLFEVAALQFSEEMKKAAADRDWSAFNGTIRLARRQQSGAWQPSLMIAARMQAEGAPREKILEELAEAVQANPDAVILFAKLALFYQQLGELELSDDALVKYRELVGGDWRADMLAAQVQMIRGGFETAIVLLDKVINEVGFDQKRNALTLKAQAQMAIGNVDAGRSTLRQLAADDDLSSMVRLAELELRLSDFDAVREQIEKIKALEGAEGIFWKYFAASLAIADDPSPQDLLDAEKYQAQIAEANPSWPLGYNLHGRILSLKENYSGAAKAFEMAVQRGDRRMQTYQELLSALFAANEFEKSERYLEEMQAIGNDTASSLSAAVDVAESHSQLPELVRRAKSVVDKSPTNTVARIWYAQLLLLSGEEEQAESQLKSAVKNSRSNIAAAAALFLYYAKRDREMATKVLELVEDNAETPLARERAIVLANGWRRLGNAERAVGFLRQAIAASPADLNLKIMLGETLLTFDRDAAEQYLREVLSQDNAPAFRRLLALSLMTKGGPKAWEEVQSLLNGRESMTQDLRVLALLSMKRGGLENLVQARELINQAIANTGVTTSGDRLLLSVTFESEGKLKEASEQLDELIKASNGNLESLAAKFDFEMRNHQYNDAERVLKKMEESAEETGLTAKLKYLNSKVNYLRLKGTQQDVLATVTDFGSEQEPLIDEENAPERSLLYATLGQILDSVRLYQDAEPWYRKLAAINENEMKPLATTLAQLNRHQEAIELLQIDLSQPNVLNADQLVALIEIVSAGTPSAEVWSQTQPAWDYAESSDDWVLNMIACFADVAQGDEEAAVQKLDRIVAANPNNSMLLNNLASLTGHLPSRAEDALEKINLAIEISGEQPYLLDTKSSILVGLGKPEEAIQLLKPLNALRRPDPRVLFRLAVAQSRTDALEEARLSYERAVALGLHSQVLTQHDRKLVAELEKALNL